MEHAALAVRLQTELAPSLPGVAVGVADDYGAYLLVYVPQQRVARGLVPLQFGGLPVRVVRLGAVRPA